MLGRRIATGGRCGGHQYDELVPAHPAQAVALADRRRRRRSERLQHIVANRMAMGVVDRLEPVEIGIGEHQRQLVSPGKRDGGRSEEHTSELQSLMRISYAVFCLKKNTIT